MRRLILPLLAPAVLLTACSAAQEEPTEPTVVTSPMTSETAEVDDDSAQPSPEPSEQEPASSPSQDDPTVDADLDLQDGVRTNDFGRMPTQIGDMSLVSKETDPSEHSVRFVYEAPDKKKMAQFMANFAFVDGESTPVVDTDSEAYRTEIDSAVASYEEAGSSVDQRSVSAGGLEWDCVEAVGPEDFDSTLCVSLRYGRVLDAQYITVQGDDAGIGQQAVEEVLTEIGEAVVALA